MASKEAQLEALLYAAGDDGLETDNLLQLLEISPSALRELANHLKDRLKNDENSGLQLICINHTYKLRLYKTHIIQYKSFTHDNSWKPVIKRISMIRSIAFHPKAMNDINNNGRSSDLFPL